MVMLFGCLHSDRTTSWNALSTSREHKYPSPLTLRVDTPVFHNKTPRAQTVPVTIPTLPRLQKQQSWDINQVFLAQDAPQKASQLWDCIPPWILLLNQGETEVMPASSPLPGPTSSKRSGRKGGSLSFAGIWVPVLWCLQSGDKTWRSMG